MTPTETSELRSFGRRRGRVLSPRQQRLLSDVLPAVRPQLTHPAPEQLGNLYNPPLSEVWLEIGFGGAEHLIWQAEHNPAIGMIGCEPFEDGVAKALIAVEERGLANVRLHPDDARDLLRWLPAASIARTFILFPDPWPKKRHAKRRLISPHLLGLLAEVMRPGAELRIGTDIGDYLRTILIAFQAEPRFCWRASGPADWRERPADWPATRYQQKAVREGRRCYYLSFHRVDGNG
ncbi:MAG: tRNA (guanosine(46)-N7)-methyltransferase TrmB [Alphaproteobacteria bacterium]|nr:tRNA (guanosine(46)-N7)-methyltransferase TrmB [Alphaproteobacteria bacterium]